MLFRVCLSYICVRVCVRSVRGVNLCLPNFRLARGGAVCSTVFDICSARNLDSSWCALSSCCRWWWWWWLWSRETVAQLWPGDSLLRTLGQVFLSIFPFVIITPVGITKFVRCRPSHKFAWFQLRINEWLHESMGRTQELFYFDQISISSLLIIKVLTSSGPN